MKICVPDAKLPTPNLKFALAPTPNPDASQWNIGGVGSWRWVFALGMYISFVGDANSTRRKPVFWWNMGFSLFGMRPIQKRVKVKAWDDTPLEISLLLSSYKGDLLEKCGPNNKGTFYTI